MKDALPLSAFLAPFGRSAAMIAVAASLALAGCSSTGTSTSNAPTGRGNDATTITSSSEPETEAALRQHPERVTRTGEIYLMRGLANVFSRGMDKMARDLRKDGYDAVAFNHGSWETYAQDIVERAEKGEVSYPIIIMGHSLGGNEAPKMANYLGARGIKTALVVTFDPTEPQVVGKNVGTVINYYLPNGRNTIRKASGFSGTLSNINVSDITDITHTNVEKNPKLQARSLSKIENLTRARRS